MIVYRLCKDSEYFDIFELKDFSNLGGYFTSSDLNTHQYEEKENYMHFFADMESLLYFSLIPGKYICVYEIPEEVLSLGDGFGYYWDYINFQKLEKVREFAIPSSKIKFEYLKLVLNIHKDIDIADIESCEDIYNYVETLYDRDRGKRLIKK